MTRTGMLLILTVCDFSFPHHASPLSDKPLVPDGSRANGKWKAFMKHVRGGCLSDPEGISFYHVLEDGSLVSRRGTSHNESQCELTTARPDRLCRLPSIAAKTFHILQPEC